MDARKAQYDAEQAAKAKADKEYFDQLNSPAHKAMVEQNRQASEKLAANLQKINETLTKAHIAVHQPSQPIANTTRFVNGLKDSWGNLWNR